MGALTFVRTVAVAAAACFAVLAPASAQDDASESTRGAWHAAVAPTDGGHLIGNPDAEAKLVEFISYSCPTCALFARQGEAPLQYVFIHSGKLNLEIRPIIRNNIDLAATMMVQCGATENFARNHAMMLNSQATWLAVSRNMTAAQKARWGDGLRAEQRRAIASDLGLYGFMAARGYEQTELDRCLNDDARAAALDAQSNADFERFGLEGTPSFVLDGTTLEHVHDWNSLEPKLQERF